MTLLYYICIVLKCDNGCIFLIHDGGGRGLGMRGRSIYGGGAALWTVRRGVETSFGVECDGEWDDEWDVESDGGNVGVARGMYGG